MKNAQIRSFRTEYWKTRSKKNSVFEHFSRNENPGNTQENQKIPYQNTYLKTKSNLILAVSMKNNVSRV